MNSSLLFPTDDLDTIRFLLFDHSKREKAQNQGKYQIARQLVLISDVNHVQQIECRFH